MRKGGGKTKGSNFEREVCKTLSLWLSHGADSSLFTRNVLSGGAYTRRTSDRGTPGDLAASDPRSHAFIQKYCVECKHHRDLLLSEFVLRPRRLSSLGQIIDKTDRQATEVRRYFFIVAKQNNREPVVLLPEIVGNLLAVQLRRIQKKVDITYHLFFGGDVFCMRLPDFVAFITPETMLEIPYVREQT